MNKMVALALLCALMCSGCTSSSLERSENPINRSILLDSGLELGLGDLPIPIPLPSFKLGFKLHYRRPTPREEIELNLSKIGKQLDEHNQVPKDKLRSSPTPFIATEE